MLALDWRTAVGLALAEHGVHTRHLFADQDVLRALVLALAALDAGAGALALVHPRVTSARVIQHVVHHAFVVERKVARDVDAVGAGHAVAAGGAGDRAERAIGVAHAVHQGQFLCRQHAHARALGAGQVLFHLLHGAHAAQHGGHLGLVPQPLQGPFGGAALHGAVSHRACTASGGLASLPPSSGSITTTASPRSAAYCRPSVPGFSSTSM